MLCLILASAVLAAPTPEAPDEAEWAKIASGDVVTRLAPELTPPGAYGWVEVKATPARIWEVLNDPAVAVASSGSVTSCERYLDTDAGSGRKIGLHYVLNVAFTEVQYHVLRDYHPDEGWMTWALDPDKASDLAHTSGLYVIGDGRTEGKVLLSYRSQVDSGRRIPKWVQQFLTGRALKSYLDYVRDTAEQG